MTGPDKNTFHYRENSIASARPEDLALMMYNGLMKFIAKAQEEIRSKSLEAAHNTLLRCQDIVFEFQYTLNMDYAVSNNLMLLYDYLYNRLIEANAKKDCEILDEVLGFVTELRDTWVEVVRLNKEQKAEAAELAEQEQADNAAAVVEAEADNGAAAEAQAPEPAADGGTAQAGMTRVEVPGASMRIGSDAPAVSKTKAIYTRSGRPPAPAAAMPVTPARNTAAYSAGMATPKPTQQGVGMAAPKTIAHGTGTSMAPASTHVSPSAGILPPAGVLPPANITAAPVKAPAASTSSAAAQYAKVSKAKNPIQEIISIASK